MAQPTANPPETASSFAAMMAASQATRAEVDLEARVIRADLAPVDQPLVRLPPRRTCSTCPNRLHRYPAVLRVPDVQTFDDLVDARDSLGDPPYQAPPRILFGIDWANGPHEAVRPGFEDLARVKDPSLLTDALLTNRVLPTCACAKALFAAADDDLWQGFKLNALKQIAYQKAKKAGPTVQPDPAMRRKTRRETPPRPPQGANLFAAFNSSAD